MRPVGPSLRTIAASLVLMACAMCTILFLMADQLRWDAVGYAGQSGILTPNIDALARLWQRGTPDSYPVEFPRILAQAGYRTAAIGKWFQQQMPGKDPQATLDFLDGNGWNSWIGRPYVYADDLHPTAWVGRQAVSFLEQNNATTPFFLKVSFHRPHSPYDPPASYLAKVTRDMLPASRTGGNWDSVFRGTPGDPPGCGATPDAWCGAMPANETLNSRLCYYANIMFIDEYIGRIVDTLKQKNLFNHTYIIFTGDHYHWRKGYPFEFSAHVPMFLRWPEVVDSVVNISRGTVIPQLMSELRDVAHTAFDVANATHLVPSVNPGPWRRFLDLEHSTVYNETVHWNALTDGEMKYVFRAFFPDELLFNLTADPWEMNNLADDASYHKELMLWRERLIEQFEREGRGPAFVQNHTLMQRTQGMTYGPNYPQGPPIAPGDEIVMQSNGASHDTWLNHSSGQIELMATNGSALGLCFASTDSRPEIQLLAQL
ncbi:uncharacterized protein MONBRDRAFT_26151 [Monosiga brevicollis MX1]|uniref:Sulfatase N-terminal domain-containing protein n=1 Tax=Monosiga brevicollis TaxID=81824 RepID=A9V1I3_MONBE|nr:uncharacterized protein MONBRDRAFT_26151 [Monosiga brevicollis MX1]EDQ88446.1 predicted protein [Monosiga brevicollis MX1]|eukprot:XP_001746550.1 hypothetical protein [Monosiga brevicollis MX1]